MESRRKRSQIKKIAERDGAFCWICKQPVDLSITWDDPMRPTRDHMKPKSKGGRNCIENIKLAHKRCNMERGSMGFKKYSRFLENKMGGCIA